MAIYRGTGDTNAGLPQLEGDMLKSVYDTNNDGIVNQADLADEATHAITADTADLADVASSLDGPANATYVDFDTVTAVAGAVARLKWNDTEGTLDLGLKGGNVTLQLGQEEVVHVYNNTGTAFTDMQVVRITGSQGTRLTAALAQANNETNSATSLAVVTEPIANNTTGFATRGGIVNNVNTNAFNEGDALWLSPSVAGGITNVKPTAPNHLVLIGWCVKKAGGAGQIYVHIQNGYELDELHDVLINGKASGNTLIYDAVTGVWKNANLTAGTGISVTNGAGSITVANTGVTSITGTASQVTASASTGGVTLSLPATINVNTSGNAATVTNGVYTTGSYADPSWITSLAGSKVTGNISGNAATATTATNQSGGTVAATTGSFSGNVTLSGGTANGVAYLNGSKVLTTGSALTFDGTSLGVGGSATNGKIEAIGTSGNTLLVASTTSNIAKFGSRPDVSSTYIGSTAYPIWLNTESNQPIQFYINGSEQMRLTSTGLGIGTSSPSQKSEIGGAASLAYGINSTNRYWWMGGIDNGSADANFCIGTGNSRSTTLLTLTPITGNLGIGTSSPSYKLTINDASGNYYPVALTSSAIGTVGNYVGLRFGYAGSTYQKAAIVFESADANGRGTLHFCLDANANANNADLGDSKLKLDYNGNLGLGVTPSAWYTGNNAKAIEMVNAGNGILQYGTGTNTTSYYLNNAYLNTAGSWTYGQTGTGSSYWRQTNGVHTWSTAPSGTAGTAISFTQAMTLDASGNVGVGLTNPARRFQVVGATPQLRVSTDTSTSGALDLGGDASGCYINANYYGSAVPLTFSTASAERMRIDSSGNVGIGTSSPTDKLSIYGGSIRLTNSTTGTTTSDGYTMETSGLNAYLWNYEAGFLSFATSATERMRIDSSGNLLVGKTSATANGGDVQVSKGITFPATQSAQSDANTLDDYEEGTWTPSVGGTATYNTTYTTGTYTKVGRLVTVVGELYITAIGSGSTGIISGLPYAANGSHPTDNPGSVGYYANLTPTMTWVTCVATGSTVYLLGNGTAGGTTIAYNASGLLKDSSRVQFSITYFV